MPDEKKLTDTVIRYSGPFDLTKFLNATRGWLLDNNYDFAEPTYKHKYGDQGQDLELEWKADRKVNFYVKEEININMVMNGIKDIEVVIDDKKQKMQQGKVFVEVSGKVYLDYQKRFEGKMQDFINKTVLKKTISKWMDKATNKVLSLIRVIRKELGTEI